MKSEPILLVDPVTLRLLHRGRRVRRILLAVVGSGILLGLLATGFAPDSEGPSVVVGRGDIVHSLSAVGRLEAELMLDVVPKIAGRIAEVHVKEGDRVAPGQILVSLEDTGIRARLAEAVHALAAAEATRAETRRGTREEDLEQARAQVAEASQALKQAEAARAAELELLGERLAVAQAEADFAASQWQRLRSLAPAAVSQMEADGAKRSHDSAQAALRRALLDRERILQSRDASSESVKGAMARLDQARSVLARLTKGATDEERRRVEAEVLRAQAVAARLEHELSETRLRSPVGGIVARRYKEPFEMAFPEMALPVLVVADDRRRIARVEVLETDIYKVEPGRPAAITSDSYPGQRWQGRVERVAPALGRKRLFSESPREKTDVKVLEAIIRFEGPPDLPLNLPLEARIEEKVRENVIMLPRRALRRGDRVRLVGGEGRTLRLGASDDTFVEVTKGLGAGERVSLAE